MWNTKRGAEGHGWVVVAVAASLVRRLPVEFLFVNFWLWKSINGWNFTLGWAPPSFHRDAVDSDVPSCSSSDFWGNWNSSVTSKDVAFSGCWIWWTILPPITLKITRRKKNKKCQRFPSRRKVTVLSAVCAYTRVPACPRCRCAKRRELRFGPMKRRCPLQVPLPRCHPGTKTLTVIGDCVLLSLHAPVPSSSLAPPPTPVLHFYLASTRRSWLLMQSLAHH